MNKRIEDQVLRIKHLESVEKSLRDRAKALLQEASGIANEKAGLKDYILQLMKDNSFTKIELDHFKISYAKGSYSVEITDENLVPTHYKKVSVAIDRKSLLSDRFFGPISGVVFHQSEVLYIKKKQSPN